MMKVVLRFEYVKRGLNQVIQVNNGKGKPVRIYTLIPI